MAKGGTYPLETLKGVLILLVFLLALPQARCPSITLP